MKKFRICWRSLITGFSEEGKEIFDRKTACALRDADNKKDTGFLKYWIASGSVQNFS